MKKHLKESHGITQTFICFICYRGFIAGTLYHKHWEEYHDRSCRFCYVTLPTLEDLKDHLVIVHQKIYDQVKVSSEVRSQVGNVLTSTASRRLTSCESNSTSLIFPLSLYFDSRGPSLAQLGARPMLRICVSWKNVV